MVETIVVILAVALAFALSGRYLFRSVAGKSQRCANGDTCPLAGACACTPDAAKTGIAPEGCPLTPADHHEHGLGCH